MARLYCIGLNNSEEERERLDGILLLKKIYNDDLGTTELYFATSKDGGSYEIWNGTEGTVDASLRGVQDGIFHPYWGDYDLTNAFKFPYKDPRSLSM